MTDDMNVDSQRDSSKVEVDEALHQMASLKFPGLDGYGACFY